MFLEVDVNSARGGEESLSSLTTLFGKDFLFHTERCGRPQSAVMPS